MAPIPLPARVPAAAVPALSLQHRGAPEAEAGQAEAEGEGAEESVNALADLLEKDLDAEE